MSVFHITSICAQSVSSDVVTNKGNDFWVMFLFNQNLNNASQANQLQLIGIGDDSCSVDIYNNQRGNTACQINALSNHMFEQTVGTNQLTIATPFNGGYHVTSTEDIWLYARNFTDNTQDAAMILPSIMLDTFYIVQDYPATRNGGEVGFVATENGTILTMTVPCNIQGTTITAGTTLNVALDQGQSYMLLAAQNSSPYGTSLSGMEVHSNGKPFAMFQGGWNPAVPINGSGRDHCYEQALPVRMWGTEFIVSGAASQGNQNGVIITSAQNNCDININGTTQITLNAGQTHLLNIQTTSNNTIIATKPVSVTLYLGSNQNSGNMGDPSSVTIPPLNRGTQKSVFKIKNSNSITSSGHFLSIICDTTFDNDMRLNGQPLPGGGTTIGRYKVHHISPQMQNEGINTLEDHTGPFVGYAYGVGSWESYAFSLGTSDTIYNIVYRDTVDVYDSVCQGFPYWGHGFELDTVQTSSAGTLSLIDSITIGNSIHYTHLTLSIFPSYIWVTDRRIYLGDTIVFQDSVITTAGSYVFDYVTSTGCDSILILNVTYEGIALNASTTRICLGEAIVLTAEGMHEIIWASDPFDIELSNQQGQNPVTVHPLVSTDYSLVDEYGNTIASIHVDVLSPPEPCLEINQEFVDFDHPVVRARNCSQDRANTTWTFSDGRTYTGERCVRQPRHPLPDTIDINMVTCNKYKCCSDTTISLPVKILSAWFPNVFIPDAEYNNRFQCQTSCDVVSFRLTIFSRNGIEIWSTNDINESWDGSCNGRPMPQGAYAYHWYIDSAEGWRRNGVGTVTLLR